MNILVVGCGRLGAELAFRLFQQGHQMTVADQSADAFANLPPDFRGRLLEGEVLSRELLERARLREQDAAAMVTSSDAVNVVLAHVARRVYDVANVAVRNYDPRRRWADEAFDLPVVSLSTWGASRFEELLTCRGARAVFSAGNGEVQVFEMPVPGRWAGRSVAELMAGCECLPVAVTRQGSGLLVTPHTRLAAGDLLLVSGTLAGAQALQGRLAPDSEA